MFIFIFAPNVIRTLLIVFLVQIFGCPRMRFAEIPMKLAGLLQHPDPIIINHIIRYGGADLISLAPHIFGSEFSASVA